MRAVAALAQADFLERVRTYAYLVTLAAVLWLGYGTYTGNVSVELGDHRGVLNSAWVGGAMALVINTFLAIAGFYVVKNSVSRDVRTGVGPILATTPMSRFEYTLGKALSNFAVLMTMVGVLTLVAAALQLLGGEDTRFDVVAFLVPLLLATVPMMAVVATLAVLFECVPFLSGGLGNAVWFVGWAMGMVAAIESKSPWLDPAGIVMITDSMMAAARTQVPGYTNGFSIHIEPTGGSTAGFTWTGLTLTPFIVLTRTWWLALAAGVTWIASRAFDRFDAGRVSQKQRRTRPTRARGGWTLPLPRGILGAELRMMLGGIPRMWWLVGAGLWIASVLAPLPAVRSGVLVALALWPLVVWSGMGCREAKHGTGSLVFSAPGVLTRQMPAAWVAGVLVAVALTGVYALRLAFAGDAAGLASWAAGAVFVPSMALALGVWSGSSKLFEAVYVALWYIGLLNHVPDFDFFGASLGSKAAAHVPPVPALWAALAAGLVVLAFLGRWRQLRLGVA